MAPCPRCQDVETGPDSPLCQGCAPASPSGAFQAALQAWRDHLPTMLLYWFLPAAAAVAARLGVLVLHGDAFDAYTQGIGDLVSGDAAPGALVGPAATLAPWLVVEAAFLAVFAGAIQPVAASLARGDDPGPGPGLRAALRRGLPILAASLLLWVTVGAGILLLVVPGLVALHWFLLAVPAAGGGAGPLEAMGEARDLVRDHGSPAFLLLAVAVWLGVDLVVVGGGDAVAAALGLGRRTAPAILAAGIVEWVFAPILPLYLATYHVHLRAADARTETAARVPDPAADPRDAIRVGRCPDCDAMVPDDVTEDGHPTCPTCGREGPLEATDT